MTVDFTNLVGFDVINGSDFNTDLFESYYVEVKLKNGYSVSTVPKLTIVSSTQGDNEFQLVLKSGTTDTYYYDYENMIPSITSVSVSGLAESGSTPSSEIDVDFSELVGFDVIEGETFDKTQFSDYDIKIKVKNGYTLTVSPILHIFRENQSESIDFQLALESGTSDTYYYTLNNVYSDIASVSVSGVAVADIQSLYTEYPLITCYKATSEKMRAISDLRFQTENNEKVDLGKYILSFVRYPLSISTLNNANIKIGYFQTSINADLIENQINIYSLGKIALVGLEENTSDISQSIIELHLPYIGIYTIESKYINTEIEVKYRLDVVSNKCVVEVFSDTELILQIDSELGYELPYILKENMYESNMQGRLNTNILKAMQAKIVVRQKAKIDGFYYDTAIEVENLNGLQGYIKTTDYNVDGIPTQTELNIIKSLMNNGIII